MDTITALPSYQNLLQITSKKRVFSHLSGEHTTAFSGNGLDFKDLRDYTTGDDIRHVNWKVTARNRNPVVNVFNEDKQLNIVFVYLNSGGLYFGTKRAKKDVVLEVLGNLMFASLSKKDKISTLFFNHDAIKFFPPSNNKTILENELKFAYELDPIGSSINFTNLSEYLLGNIKQKSVIFLIGDFLELSDLKLLSKKHELYPIIIRDRFEEDLRLFGEFNLIDANIGKMEQILLDKNSCEKYNNLIKEHDHKLISHFKKLRLKYTKIYTDEHILAKLKGLLV